MSCLIRFRSNSYVHTQRDSRVCYVPSPGDIPYPTRSLIVITFKLFVVASDSSVLGRQNVLTCNEIRSIKLLNDGWNVSDAKSAFLRIFDIHIASVLDRIDGQMDGLIDGWIDRQMNGWVRCSERSAERRRRESDSWQIHRHIHVCLIIHVWLHLATYISLLY